MKKARQTPKSVRKLKISKKLLLKNGKVTLSDVAQNLGTRVLIQEQPGNPIISAFLPDVDVKDVTAGDNRGKKQLFGFGKTAEKARRDLIKKLVGKVLTPKFGGPCHDGKPSMRILKEVSPKYN